MDGAKSVTDRHDNPKGCGRQAFCASRMWFERTTGSLRNENPGVSRIIVL
jgi:hypothetical protein